MKAAAVLAALLLTAACHRSADAPGEHFEGSTVRGVEVVATAPAREQAMRSLVFRITNTTDKKITVPERILPWGGNAVNWGDKPVLAVTVTADGKELKDKKPLRQHLPDTLVKLEPGQSAEGVVPLIWYYDFPKEMKHGVVEWKYRLEAIGDQPREYSGKTELP